MYDCGRAGGVRPVGRGRFSVGLRGESVILRVAMSAFKLFSDAWPLADVLRVTAGRNRKSQIANHESRLTNLRTSSTGWKTRM